MSNTFSGSSYPLLAAGFVESCSLFPSRPAIHIRGEFFTYAQLLEKAEIIFMQLSEAPVPAYIGIYTTESVWTYAAILAISLSGACYVPLNSKLPALKLQEIVNESDLQRIITETPLPFVPAAAQLVIDTTGKNRKACTLLIEQEKAYLLFTSGTTGQPKGVPVSKENAAAFFAHYQAHYDFNKSDRFLQPYELSFDVSVFSMFAAWNAGACVYCVAEEGVKYMNIVNTLRDHQITVSSMVPTVLLYLEKYLKEFSFPHLRYSFFSGDKLYQHLAAQWQHAAFNAQIHNCYGPTETTVVCTVYPWRAQDSEQEAVNNIVPLGKPFKDMEFILLDEQATVISTGSGELCFSGPQVIAAYLNQHYEDRFFQHAGKRYYKTGDRAEVNSLGNLVFCGRTDTQVKINGFRVELAEIEHALARLTNCNVIVLPVEEEQLTTLVAFIETDTMDEAGWKKSLANAVPGYMLPGRYMAVSSFPRNINGKIDRRQLKTRL